MVQKTLDLESMTHPDALASQIANKYVEWNSMRQPKMSAWEETRNYVFATDTTTTSNSSLPWKNKTTLPKLCQIRDNLHANYMANLFPNKEWLDWSAGSQEDAVKAKRTIIKDYVLTKCDQSGFEDTISQCVLDWIDTGNCFIKTDYVREGYEDEDGNFNIKYQGPKAVRISPYDIVFDITAASFEDAAKIQRSLCSLGELKTRIDAMPEAGYLSEAFTDQVGVRRGFANASTTDAVKDSSFRNDGLGSYIQYMQGDTVELLDFYGSIYDIETGDLMSNYMITVMDRCRIIRKIKNPSWLGSAPIRHCGWRKRPDSLLAMGPLDNLVGLQYRIDHLENLKADSFDIIAFPIMKIKGQVEEFVYAPGARINVSEEGDVEFMHPDVTSLSADNQISLLENKMEEYAGAPKQAMGIRTPGEKTKYEVQTLENAASRLFMHKIATFEKMFEEPVVNDMLEVARRNMNEGDIAKTLEDSTGTLLFTTVTKEDISGKGRLTPIGARSFAYKANLVQNITNMMNSPIGADPSINVHWSGLKLSRLIEEALDLQKFDLVKENVRITEQANTQKLASRTQEDMQIAAMQNMPEDLPGME